MSDSNLPPQILYQHAQFLKSAPSIGLCPPDRGIEIAFVGRSNSGKSSAINAITNINRLARTSKTPGRTQLINFFGLDDDRRLVDLPGYGYAKIPDRVKAEIETILQTYLSERACLHGLCLTMDIRRPMTSFDQQLIDFTVSLNRPVHILLTKSDKLKRTPANQALLSVRKMVEGYGSAVTVQTFSALRLLGIDEAKLKLDEWFVL